MRHISDCQDGEHAGTAARVLEVAGRYHGSARGGVRGGWCGRDGAASGRSVGDNEGRIALGQLRVTIYFYPTDLSPYIRRRCGHWEL